MDSRVGLFGGSFNPIHHGHLVAVQETVLELDLDSALLIPTHHPPHRSEPEISAGNRATMTELAVIEDPDLTISRVELDRDGPSYTYETIRILQENYPETEFFFLTGADQLVQFKKWHKWQEIMDTCTVVGMSRPGFDRRSVPDDVMEQCRFVDIPEIEISSSEIRRRIKNGDPVRYFLPESVHAFIRENKLYE